MQNIVKKTVAGITAGASMLAMAGTGLAAHNPQHYTLDGDATHVSPGNASSRAVQLVSDATPPVYGAVVFPIEPGTTFSELTTLSTDFNITDDDCGGGSPRFQIRIDENNNGIIDPSDGNIHVAFGPSPTFTNCAPGWQNTGNLIGNNDAGRYDSGQVGGSAFGTYQDALNAAGTLNVLEIRVVADGFWNADATNGDGEQTVLIDNTRINQTLFTYELPVPTSREQCRNGGWQNLTDNNGTPFRNQGDCVSFFSTGGRNEAAGTTTPGNPNRP